jgi:hypothetical protein
MTVRRRAGGEPSGHGDLVILLIVAGVVVVLAVLFFGGRRARERRLEGRREEANELRAEASQRARRADVVDPDVDT